MPVDDVFGGDSEFSRDRFFQHNMHTHRHKHWHEPGKQRGGGEFNKHMAYSCDVGAQSAALWQEEMTSFSLHCEKLLQANKVKK